MRYCVRAGPICVCFCASCKYVCNNVCIYAFACANMHAHIVNSLRILLKISRQCLDIEF